MDVSPIQIHPNEYIEVFNMHQESDYIYTPFLSMLETIDKRSIKIGTLSNVETFPFVCSSVSRTDIILKPFETIYSTKHIYILQIIHI